MMRMWMICFLALFATVLLIHRGAQAATMIVPNLVDNGGFESGTFVPWLLSLPSGHDAGGGAASFGPPHTGGYAFWGYDNDGTSSLSQSFATTPGHTYDVSFWSFIQLIDSGHTLYYALDGQSPVLVPTTDSWANTTTSFVASGSSSSIAFYFHTAYSAGSWNLDDIEVTPAVPEPTSTALFMLAMTGLAMVRRR